MRCARALSTGRRFVAPRLPAYVTTFSSVYLSLICDDGAAFQISRRCSSASAHGSRSSATASASKLNYYSHLGVDTDATLQEVKTAYRQLALRYHPDVAREENKAHAEMLFRRVSEAYEVLSDPERRRAHDTELGIQTRRKQQPSAAGASRAQSFSASARMRKDTASTTSSTSSAAQQQQHRRRYRKPFVRGDANRVFADAFDGKTLDEILFDAQRRRRQEKAASAAAARRRDTSCSSEHAASNASPKSSSPSSSIPEESVALDRDARLRHIMETSAESFAQQAQRQYGHGIIRHIRASATSLPRGPAAPPEAYMPFRPFVGMPIPPGVQTPPEPKLGKVLSSQEATVDGSSTPDSHGTAWYEIPKQFHTHQHADGTPQSRVASLTKATKYIQGMPHNMGQLYSYHRPY
ncbi:hypothetical protein JKF63_02901 [Porcisia hertigi]|uniref:J domain-containing protein n=1 Tax=Porcisia hertigi TaxID=2761500 RepID=A0A836I863_9TRYP|nr:hypothetical protein JKF63_02901 [Porcisia hertigi]